MNSKHQLAKDVAVRRELSKSDTESSEWRQRRDRRDNHLDDDDDHDDDDDDDDDVSSFA
jgi:hypothetical protein